MIVTVLFCVVLCSCKFMIMSIVYYNNYVDDIKLIRQTLIDQCKGLIHKFSGSIMLYCIKLIRGWLGIKYSNKPSLLQQRG